MNLQLLWMQQKPESMMSPLQRHVCFYCSGSSVFLSAHLMGKLSRSILLFPQWSSFFELLINLPEAGGFRLIECLQTNFQMVGMSDFWTTLQYVHQTVRLNVYILYFSSETLRENPISRIFLRSYNSQWQNVFTTNWKSQMGDKYKEMTANDGIWEVLQKVQFIFSLGENMTTYLTNITISLYNKYCLSLALDSDWILNFDSLSNKVHHCDFKILWNCDFMKWTQEGAMRMCNW